MAERAVRFHQSVAFLPTRQILPLARVCDDLGYGGMYVSDHLFNPRRRESRYTYSTSEDGAPGWDDDTAWPDPMCVISACAGATENLLFTTGIYIAPLRDLMTAAKTVGTTAVLSDNRLRLGIGVGWCKEEFDQTGQDFATRGKRLDEMIVALRALWRGGYVEFHGDFYDVPECQMEPAPNRAGAHHRGRPLPRRAPAGRRAVRRLDRRRRLQRGGGVAPPRPPPGGAPRRPAATKTASASTFRSTSRPTSTSTVASPTPG